MILLSILILISGVEIGFSQLVPNQEKNILILHSYHQGLEWTDNITEGILSVLGERRDINLFFEYLDTKRFYRPEYIEALRDINIVKNRQIEFDAIISADNAAYGFLKMNHQDLYPDTPIVFCGVNNLNRHELADYPFFYGYEESAEHRSTLDSIQSIFPERPNILIINDNTLTGQNILSELKSVLPDYAGQLNFEIISDFTLDSLQRRVAEFDSSWVIYLLVVNRDSNGGFISYAKGISHIRSVCEVPIFGSWDFYIDKGLFGGKITEGREHGKNAALLAEQIIDNGITGTIQQYNSVNGSYIFDYNELERFDVSIKELPANSSVINNPNNERLQIRIVLLTALLLLLSAVILLLRLLINKKRNEKLKMLVEEKTRGLTEANSRLEDIILKNKTFFSILAHDLRHSIGSLVQVSSLLNDDEITLDAERERAVKKEMLICANNTNGLLEDLLYWGYKQFENRAEADISEVQMDLLLSAITKLFIHNQGNVKFTFQIKKNTILKSDINIITFVFRNIIQNAVKFSRPEGLVTIRCLKENENAVITVVDQGIGMTGEVIESIYNKKPIIQKGIFDKKNTGLGLPTVIEYLEELKGEVSIESEPGKGTSVTIRIPDWED